MAQAGFQQRGILIEILLFRWRRRAHFCEKCLCKSPEGRELGRELRVLGYVLLWWSEKHQAHGWAHGSLIGCINNNIGSEKANSSAGICVSHRAHPRQPTAPETPLSKVPESKTLTCQKSLKLAGTSLKSLLHSWIPISSRQVPHVLWTFYWLIPWSNLHTAPAHPCWLLCPGEMCLETQENHTSSQSSHSSSVLSS